MEKIVAKIQYALPILMIAIVAILMIERQKQSVPESTLLAPPRIDVSSLDVRGEEVWDFELPDLEGMPVKLSDFKGNVVVLNFFGSWCEPCGKEMPSLEKAFQRNKEHGLVVLGIAADPEGAKTVTPFLKQHNVTFPVLLDPKNEVFSRYFVRAIPVTYLLDRKGKIATMYRGEADWSSSEAQVLLDHLLKEPIEDLEATVEG
jgi:peroxiredoxin